MKLATRLLISFIAIGLIPAAIIGVMSLNESRDSMEQKAYDQLIGLRDVKKGQIEQFFTERKGDMGVLIDTVGTLRDEALAKLTAIKEIKKNHITGFFDERFSDVTVLSSNTDVKDALAAFSSAFQAEGNKVNGPLWTIANDHYGASLTQYQKEYGYYDLFLINATGDIVYTVSREADLGQNLVQGNLKTSGLGRCFQKGLLKAAVGDFTPYAPSNNEPAAFIGAPVQQDGKVVGVVALQISLDAINKIMMERNGLGKTGETYLVGSDHLMRSDSFLDPKHHTVKASFANPNRGSVDTEAANQALSGKSGSKVINDYNGNPVLSSYAPIAVGDMRWAILSEIDIAEAFCPVDKEGIYYYKKYIEKYGYYDLFLINPNGHCFYTVTREADYNTNLVDGTYASSGLGNLTRQVLQSQSYGLADFEPYAPSHGEPAAFIAQPLVVDGTIEMIVALQLSLTAINNVMQQRDGMGKTGETYLVGSDMRMRSDSFLDPSGHTVKASFAGTVTSNGCDTDTVREALTGKTDAKIKTDYNGNPVLSAYTPLHVGDTTWDLLAEIDQAEAFATVSELTALLLYIGGGVLLAILIIGPFISRSITNSVVRPIKRVIDSLRDGSGQVTDASGQVSSSSQGLAEGTTEQAASLEETSSSLEEMSSMTKQNADNAEQANTLATSALDSAIKGNDAMGRMNGAIAEIQKSADETAKIIKVIDEIAFQTNLLALNAAVEAARAGEAGKGFAVVAKEVRNLAMRSAEAAKDTAAMIEESVRNSQNGVQLASEVSSFLEEITGSSNQVGQLIAEITASSHEQSQGIDQINTAVSQMDQVTQQNAANAEESAAASEELSSQAEQLNSLVADLVSIIGASDNDGSGPSKERSKKKKRSQKTTRKQRADLERQIPLDDQALGEESSFLEF